MIRRTLLAAMVAASVGALAAPAVAQVGLTVRIGPPAPRDEGVPAPRRGYDWTPGYWIWNGRRNRHIWVAGSWVRTRPGYTYAQPTWIERDGRWQQQRGAWARRDRDGDGGPNRRDNAPDNPRRN